MAFQRLRIKKSPRKRGTTDWAEHYSKMLDENGGLPESKIINSLRSAVRKVWMQSPVKLAFFYSKRIPEFRENSKKKWVWQCEHCYDYFGKDEVEVDHKNGEYTLKNFDDLASFSKSILDITIHDLQILCIGCHEIKTYAERYNLSLSDARIMKKVILLQKDKLDKQVLTDRGLKPASNAEKRKQQLFEYFKTYGGDDEV